MKTATFTLPDYPDITIDITQSYWTGKTKVLVNELSDGKAGELKYVLSGQKKEMSRRIILTMKSMKDMKW